MFLINHSRILLINIFSCLVYCSVIVWVKSDYFIKKLQKLPNYLYVIGLKYWNQRVMCINRMVTGIKVDSQ